MRWIKFRYVCSIVEGKENILEKKIVYSEENLQIAKAIACDGEYEILEGEEEVELEPHARVAWGSYIGWGSPVHDAEGELLYYTGVGEDSPCVLEFDFEPKLLYILDIDEGESRQIFFPRVIQEQQTSVLTVTYEDTWVADKGIYICWNCEGGKVMWFAYSPFDDDEDDPVVVKPVHQFNKRNNEYVYVAIG